MCAFMPKHHGWPFWLKCISGSCVFFLGFVLCGAGNGDQGCIDRCACFQQLREGRSRWPISDRPACGFSADDEQRRAALSPGGQTSVNH
jgi:hypothetical protein